MNKNVKIIFNFYCSGVALGVIIMICRAFFLLFYYDAYVIVEPNKSILMLELILLLIAIPGLLYFTINNFLREKGM